MEIRCSDDLILMLESLKGRVTGLLAHQPLDHTRVAGEWPGIRVIGGDETAHGIFCIQAKFQADGPLDCTGLDIFVIDKGNDTCSSFHLDIGVRPFKVVEGVEVMLHGTVSGHRRGFVKRHTAKVDGDILLLVDVVHDVFCLGLKCSPRVPPYEWNWIWVECMTCSRPNLFFVLTPSASLSVSIVVV